MTKVLLNSDKKKNKEKKTAKKTVVGKLEKKKFKFGDQIHK